MLTHRQRFVELLLQKKGSVVLMGANGPDVFDCSGLGFWALRQLGLLGPDGKPFADHSAQMFADETANLVTLKGALPLPGDFCFHGYAPDQVSHVSYWLAGGGCISADGATKRVTDLDVATAKSSCRVRLHPVADFRADLPWFAIHRNHWLNDLDGICL